MAGLERGEFKSAEVRVFEYSSLPIFRCSGRGGGGGGGGGGAQD